MRRIANSRTYKSSKTFVGFAAFFAAAFLGFWAAGDFGAEVFFAGGFSLGAAFFVDFEEAFFDGSFSSVAAARKDYAQQTVKWENGSQNLMSNSHAALFLLRPRLRVTADMWVWAEKRWAPKRKVKMYYHFFRLISSTLKSERTNPF
jgi:hypothetical protein